MKREKYIEIQQEIESYGFTIVAKDFERPWGAFLVIKEEQTQDFANRFFAGIDVNTLRVEGELSPKILIVKPGARLSWQYHHRRAEIWHVYKGEVGIIRSNDDTIPEKLICEEKGIELIDGLGNKIQSSSWLLKNTLKQKFNK